MESSWSSSPERVEPRFGEGAPTPPREGPDPLARSLAEPRFEYAGFWQRAVALLIDWLIVVVIALSALAIPLKGLHLAFPSDSTAPTDTTVRKASDMMADAFGPGREGPLLVVVDARDQCVRLEDRAPEEGRVDLRAALAGERATSRVGVVPRDHGGPVLGGL